MDGTRIPGAYYWSQEDLVRHYQYLWALHPALRQQVWTSPYGALQPQPIPAQAVELEPPAKLARLEINESEHPTSPSASFSDSCNRTFCSCASFNLPSDSSSSSCASSKPSTADSFQAESHCNGFVSSASSSRKIRPRAAVSGSNALRAAEAATCVVMKPAASQPVGKPKPQGSSNGFRGRNERAEVVQKRQARREPRGAFEVPAPTANAHAAAGTGRPAIQRLQMDSYVLQQALNNNAVVHAHPSFYYPVHQGYPAYLSPYVAAAPEGRGHCGMGETKPEGASQKIGGRKRAR